MKLLSQIAVAVAALGLAALACDLPQPGPADPKDVEQSVAETLTALAGGEATEPSASDTPEATISPVPGGGLPVSVLRIVYTDGGNVWIIDGTNPPLQLTSSGLVEQVRIS